MATLEELERRIKQKLAGSEEERRTKQEQLHNGMMELQARLSRYTAVADRLTCEVIRPRLQKLVDCFDNAHLSEEEGGRHSVVCRFEPNDRFPATATLELGITRDGEAHSVELYYSLSILPVFFPFDKEGHLVQLLESVDEDKVATWVEDRILGFLDVYLRLETLESYQAENAVTDPVCGMPLNKVHASAETEYRGAKYYFCVEDCRRKFLAGPDRYLAAFPGRAGT
jgi:YHS domain-containing protein